MVFDIVLQTEINKKENRLYPFRKREFRPNPTGIVVPIHDNAPSFPCSIFSFMVFLQ